MASSSDVNRALEACGYSSVGGDLAGIIASGVNRATGSDRNEAAMFTAQLIHESGGFQFREEQGGANQHYTPYHGRGFIQLTHDYNYKDASQDLYGDKRLMSDPGLKNVRDRGGPSQNNFGLTTKAINGGIESSSSHRSAVERYKHYRAIASAWESTTLPSISTKLT
ncbi:hypothetical protein pipiens_011332 [Culex pipiens pipiens]|uniref:Uncharacterized protein n=1 Tax=Culex pipiens pipiens TaxID=38569 RepID=A0ABD1D6T9_CULPP